MKSVHTSLGEILGNYLASDRLADWQQAKANMPEGTVVRGNVILRSPFGVWLDLGIGFPALLEIIYIDGLTPEKYRLDDYCPLGATVSAKVLAFQDSRRQIYLMQTLPSSSQRDSLPGSGSV